MFENVTMVDGDKEGLYCEESKIGVCKKGLKIGKKSMLASKGYLLL